MYQLSVKSNDKLDSCEPDLQLIFRTAIKRTLIDFGISEGHRSTERQIQLYQQGRNEPGKIVTHIDGVTKKGKHNYSPSKAVDIFAYVNGKASWSPKYMHYLGGVITATAAELLEKGVISHKLKWGGTWTKFKDYPHFELIE